jgi:hypothetical protein
MKRQPIVSALRKLPLLAFTMAAAGACLASSGREAGSPLPVRSFEQSGWTVADFDGDKQPDLAFADVKGRGRYALELELSTRREGTSAVRNDFPALPSSPFGLHLTARDVDGDHDLDIVITAGFAHQPLAVWINDGQGQFKEGDAAAYPAWIWHEGASVSTQSVPSSSQPLFGQNLRSGFCVDPGRALHWPVPGSNGKLVQRPYLLTYPTLADTRPARAPPLPFFF